VLRDADTFTKSSLWLKTLCDMNQASGADLIIGPVDVAPVKGLLGSLQAMEMMVLNLLSCGSARHGLPFLSSGANLSFTKGIFNKVGGYARHAHLESGDDIFFLEDVKKVSNNGIAYLKSKAAIVYTYPETTLPALFSQRVRWASKLRQNRNVLNFVIATLVFLVNLTFLVALLALPTGVRIFALLYMVVKYLVDLSILGVARTFAGSSRTLLYSLPLAFIYPIYTLAIAAGVMFTKPVWKK
jgi:poly-beta-1,6-N-acetyl-D-glucosamine synthase